MFSILGCYMSGSLARTVIEFEGELTDLIKQLDEHGDDADDADDAAVADVYYALAYILHGCDDESLRMGLSYLCAFTGFSAKITLTTDCVELLSAYWKSARKISDEEKSDESVFLLGDAQKIVRTLLKPYEDYADSGKEKLIHAQQAKIIRSRLCLSDHVLTPVLLTLLNLTDPADVTRSLLQVVDDETLFRLSKSKPANLQMIVDDKVPVTKGSPLEKYIAQIHAQTKMFFTSSSKVRQASDAIASGEYLLPNIQRKQTGFEIPESIYKVTKPVLAALKAECSYDTSTSLVAFVNIQAILHDKPDLSFYERAYFGDEIDGLPLTVMTKVDIGYMAEQRAHQMVNMACMKFGFAAFYQSQVENSSLKSKLAGMMSAALMHETVVDTQLYVESALDGGFTLRPMKLNRADLFETFDSIELEAGAFEKKKEQYLAQLERGEVTDLDALTIAYLIFKDPSLVAPLIRVCEPIFFGSVLQKLKHYGMPNPELFISIVAFEAFTICDEPAMFLNLIFNLAETHLGLRFDHTLPLINFFLPYIDGSSIALPHSLPQFTLAFERCRSLDSLSLPLLEHLLQINSHFFTDAEQAKCWFDCFECYLAMSPPGSTLPLIKPIFAEEVSAEQQLRIHFYLADRYATLSPASLQHDHYVISPEMLRSYHSDVLEGHMYEFAKRPLESSNRVMPFWGSRIHIKDFSSLLPEGARRDLFSDFLSKTLDQVANLPEDGDDDYTDTHKLKRVFLNGLLNGAIACLFHQNFEALPGLVDKLKKTLSTSESWSLTWGLFSHRTADCLTAYKTWIDACDPSYFVAPARASISALKETIFETITAKVELAEGKVDEAPPSAESTRLFADAQMLSLPVSPVAPALVPEVPENF